MVKRVVAGLIAVFGATFASRAQEASQRIVVTGSVAERAAADAPYAIGVVDARDAARGGARWSTCPSRWRACRAWW